MAKHLVWAALGLCLGLGAAAAAEPETKKQPEVQTLLGTLKREEFATCSPDGKTMVRWSLTVGEEKSYYLQLDEKGLKKVEGLDGQMVQVKGEVDAGWIKVKELSPVAIGCLLPVDPATAIRDLGVSIR
jgi:hypothetical protein